MLYRVLCEVYILYGDEDDQRRDKGGVFKTCCMESWNGKIEHPLITPLDSIMHHLHGFCTPSQAGRSAKRVVRVSG